MEENKEQKLLLVAEELSDTNSYSTLGGFSTQATFGTVGSFGSTAGTAASISSVGS